MALRSLLACFALFAAIALIRNSVEAAGEVDGAPFLYTVAKTYEPLAWMHGGERFPAGATVFIHDAKGKRPLVPAFTVSADPSVSFDGKRVLFSGKRGAGDRWQIWEVVTANGEVSAITAADQECIRPFYLPEDRIVYARKVDGRFTVEAADLAGGKPLGLTYGPANFLATDVLRDGRIFFEAGYPLGSEAKAELYTVYSDGSGVESYRCDHTGAHHQGKQVGSGDIIFASPAGLSRFTSARAQEVRIAAPAGEYAGDVAELPSGDWLIPWRLDATVPFRLEMWSAGAPSLRQVEAEENAHVLQPVLLAERPSPNRHPSGLHDWANANLLCLNAYTSKYSFAPGTIHSVRVYARDRDGDARLLGSAPVERDGSFFVQLPTETGLQIELLDSTGKTLKRESGFFWMRHGEQRVCVGCHAGPQTAPENAVPQILLKSTIPADLTGTQSASGGRVNRIFSLLWSSSLLASSFMLAQSGATAPSTIRFEDATAKSGINFTHSFGAERLGSLLESTGSGCVWFDYNNDGFPDLYVASGKPLEDGIHPYPLKQQPAVAPHNHLYRNNGDGTFTDVTDTAGVAANIFGTAAIAADYDNDGFVDLLVTGYGKAILYHNNRDGTFTDVTAKAGIKVDGWSIGSAWLDYDRDGCVDLFVGRYVKFDPKYRNYYSADNYPGPLDYAGNTNRLFHNNCDGTFTDVTDKSGIGAYKGRTMGVTAADFDGDGYPDIYVANDKTENFLFHNKHDGTFEEIAGDLGVAYGQNGENTSAMGPVLADLDGDGRLDLWVTDSKYNRLMRNAGDKGFEDIGPSSGISQATAQYTSWGTGIYDFDNDGWLDILIFHGGLIHLVPQEQSLFRGLGNGKFADVSREAGTVLDVKTVSRGACFADYDNDGKIDAYVVNLGAPGILLHNVTQNANHWLTIKLKGNKSNRDGIGARLELLAGGRKQIAERFAGSGYLSQDDGRIHFGLGTATKADKLTIHWPSGKEQMLENLAVDRVVTVEEP